MSQKPVIDKLAESLRAAERNLRELRPIEFPIGQYVLVDDLYDADQRARAMVTFHPDDKVASLGILVREKGCDTQYIVNIERCSVC